MPVGAAPPIVQVEPTMKYWLRRSAPGTCVASFTEIISELEAAVLASAGLGVWLNAAPKAFMRMTLFGAIMPGEHALLNATMLVKVAVTWFAVWFMQLNGPADPLTVNSHVPAVFCGTVCRPAVEIYW